MAPTGGAVLLAEVDATVPHRSPEEVIAESTAHCRESGRLTWVVLVALSRWLTCEDFCCIIIKQQLDMIQFRVDDVMEKKLAFQTEEHERKLVEIVRRLPPERVSQVIDFAQFLELQITKTYDDYLLEDGESEEVAIENARWDALLATDESQRLLEKMADEALADIRAGCAKPMVFTEDGEIAPG